MGKFIDLTDMKFGRLTVIKRAGTSKLGVIKWLCKCECGQDIVVLGGSLKSGETKSCGCLRKEVTGNKHRTHGESNSKLYNVWRSMKARCESEYDSAYKDYGARGIKLCPEWHDFLTFYKWSHENGYKEGLSIDRIDFDGNYEPSNCRWADAKTQANNTRRNCFISFNGETMTITQWAEKTGIPKTRLRDRLHKLNWSAQKALTTPKC